MERFIPVECFRKKKVIPFEVFPFSRFYRKFLSHLFTLTSARVFTILPRKNVKDLKDGGRFPKRLLMQSVSFLIGSVSGRFLVTRRITLVTLLNVKLNLSATSRTLSWFAIHQLVN